MNSKRSHEGYFLLDHRASPGVPDAMMVKQGLIPGSGRGFFESATFTCSHCERVVILNPDRSRERGYCRKCDHYVCDNCETARVASGGVCYTIKQLADELRNVAAKKIDSSEVFQSPVLRSDPPPTEPDVPVSSIIIP